MDLFIEKMVRKKKDIKDYLIIFFIVILALFVIYLLPFYLRSFALVADVGVLYGAYKLIRARNKEYEYALTNGEIDIDVIIDKKKRKKIFTANCKEFEVLEKINGSHYRQYAGKVTKTIKAVSSMKAEDIYYFVLYREKDKIMVYFEPDDKMIKAIKTYIPEKVFE